jgi:hypothetical protein
LFNWTVKLLQSSKQKFKKERKRTRREKDHKAMDIVDSLLGEETLGVGLKFNYVCKNKKHTNLSVGFLTEYSRKGKSYS